MENPPSFAMVFSGSLASSDDYDSTMVDMWLIYGYYDLRQLCRGSLFIVSGVGCRWGNTFHFLFPANTSSWRDVTLERLGGQRMGGLPTSSGPHNYHQH